VAPKSRTGVQGALHRITEEYDTTKRRRFTAVFMAQVVLDVLRGDKTIQEIATKHKVHPSQVSTWKRQAMGGGRGLFERRRPRPPEP
jgi:transposase-like protein